MKYLKLYEDIKIDFDGIDWEETEPIKYKFKIGEEVYNSVLLVSGVVKDIDVKTYKKSLLNDGPEQHIFYLIKTDRLIYDIDEIWSDEIDLRKVKVNENIIYNIREYKPNFLSDKKIIVYYTQTDIDYVKVNNIVDKIDEQWIIDNPVAFEEYKGKLYLTEGHHRFESVLLLNDNKLMKTLLDNAIYYKVNKKPYFYTTKKVLKINEKLEYCDYKEWYQYYQPEKYKEIIDFFKLFKEHDKNYNRIYIPIKKVNKDISYRLPEEIYDFLYWYDYYDIDPENGLVKDKNNNWVKIGKLLNRLGKPELVKIYQNSKQDILKNVDDLYVVISRHPYDIIGMSTDRGWTTCLNLKDSIYNKEHIHHIKDNLNGNLISYLIRKDDKNINNPISRRLIILNEYIYSDMYYLDRHTYGTHLDEYENILNMFVNLLNKRKKTVIKKYVKQFYEKIETVNETIDFDDIDWEEENFDYYDEYFKNHEYLYNFLKENNIVEKFVNNFYDKKCISKQRIDGYLNKNNDNLYKFLNFYKKYKYHYGGRFINIFDEIFRWRETIEGYRFWLNIKYEWIKYVNKNKYKG